MDPGSEKKYGSKVLRTGTQTEQVNMEAEIQQEPQEQHGMMIKTDTSKNKTKNLKQMLNLHKCNAQRRALRMLQ